MMKNNNFENYQVVKSNDFIQTTQNDLNKTQKRIIAYLFSIVHKDDKEFRKFNVSINDILTLMGNTKSGDNYKTVAKAFNTLDDKKWWISIDNGKTIERIRFFGNLKIGTNEIEGTLSESLKPYLLELQNRFTSYQLVDYISLKSSYSMNLFEYLKSFQAQGSLLKPIDEIKEIMGATANTYKEYKRFNDLILKKVIKEINETTDMYIVCTPKKATSNRSYTHLLFTLKAQNKYLQLGVFENVFITNDELHEIVYTLKAKYLIDEYSIYKLSHNLKTRKGTDYKTILKWYKKNKEHQRTE